MKKMCPTVFSAERIMAAKGLTKVDKFSYESKEFKGSIEIKGKLRVELRIWRKQGVSNG